MKTLREIQPGQSVQVVRLHGAGPVRRRIMDMGITKGTPLTRTVSSRPFLQLKS